MSQTVLQNSKDAEICRMAQKMIADQKKDINQKKDIKKPPCQHCRNGTV